MSKDIWVYSEITNEKINDIVPELLSKSVELKNELGGNVVAIVLGKSDCDILSSLSSYGADKIICCENAALVSYNARPYAEALTELCKKYEPSIFLFPATPIGYEVAPLTMSALNTGLTADAIDLFVDEDGDFIQTTPGFGGNILAHICIGEKRPQMVTVRSKVFEPKTFEKPMAEIISEAISVQPDSAYELLEIVGRANDELSLKNAKIVVACGRGVKSQEDLGLIKGFADCIGAQLACSRPLVDCGWLPHELQLGQSGNTVKADLIINIGISGSTQYLAGMQKSKCIISINTNDSAPIMNVSNYSIIADYRKLIPAAIKKLKS